MKKLLVGVAASLAFAGAALAQTPTLPGLPSGGVQSTDLFQDVVGGYPQAQSFYATAAQLGIYGQQLGAGNYDNGLIGGDFSTGMNLFQRGTSVSTTSTTYYVAYGADRWFTWGGTSTPTTMTQQTGSTDVPPDAGGSYRINKGSLTGTAQICTAQIIEGAASTRYQGKVVEFDFWAKAGPTFSAASSNLAVYISTGTVADEGATKMAYGLNTQGGSGTTAWTGQVNLGGTTGFLIPIGTAWAKYAVAGPIPANAAEIGVSICYTPVGTGTSTDWFEFEKAQFDEAPQITTAGTAGAVINSANVKAFARRSPAIEAALQYRYYYRINEVDTAGVVQGPVGTYDTTTTCSIAFPLPSAMRVTPTFDAGNLSATTFTIAPSAVATPVVLASTFGFIQSGNTSTTMGAASFKTTTETVHITCALTSTASGAGYFGFNAEE